ncbi:YidC/Oxa1 family membrane protein insertase [Peptostreptococcus equinus]|uniref:YidC/Oxa1 family membrane protein insertase n=1 Tax=Peptostreptococcus equinus TaxID=3003601 RepID=A0ABY7JP25_9FIRM|nr:YidC/Oxa1 family membrane protein insertase [Peptostreptococcus sp. CBA3647]WAW14914.1 YidC/Oxa1 family membrane protein insertase [Peptostreptococcus sp. CBA3647]
MGYIADLLGMALRAIYEMIGSYGLAIIVFTIIIKLILTPLTVKQTKSTFAMSEISPKIKEIQAKYKNKPEKQNEEIQKIYKESGVNPMAGCLPLLVQMPILFALFYVFREPLKHGVFDTKQAFDLANGSFLWFHSLVKPDIPLAILSGISGFFMQLVMTPKDQMQGPMKSMLYIMPAMSLFWGLTFPAALTLYWTISNLFSIVQFYVVTKPLKRKLEDGKSDKLNGRKAK